MKFTITTMFILVISFSGCEFFEDSQELQEKKQELALKKLQLEQERELAKINMQHSLAKLESDKLIEVEKMKHDIRAKELDINSEKELELIKQKIVLQESNNTLYFQQYLFMLISLVVVIVAFFLFYYLKKRREDKLRAYEDNLKKYFYMRENENKMRIAEKILDTIKEGDLSKENEQKLINAFSGESEDADIVSIEDKK